MRRGTVRFSAKLQRDIQFFLTNKVNSNSGVYDILKL